MLQLRLVTFNYYNVHGEDKSIIIMHFDFSINNYNVAVDAWHSRRKTFSNCRSYFFTLHQISIIYFDLKSIVQI